MKDSCKHLLKLIYNYKQKEEKGKPFQICADGSDTGFNPQQLRTDINYLKSEKYIIEVMPILRSYVLALTEKGEQFVESNFQLPSETPANYNIFNIENATNSVIGSQANVTLNINDAIHKTREQIDMSNSTDKEELQKIINLLEMVVDNQVPVQKGLLSKFSDVIQRNAWITSPVASIFLNWLTMQ